MALWSEKILEIISMLLNLLRLALCPNMWSILEKAPCVVDKNVYSDSFGCSVLKISIKSNFSIVSYRIGVALLILCLGVLKSPTMILFPSISPFMSVSICCIYLGCTYPIFGAYILAIIIPSS